jgi:hypothetical protein
MDLAAILDDIDADLAAIEAKPVKAHQLKQGMTRELVAREVSPI